MSDSPVIEAKGLTKVYKLYDRPQQKFLDMMGLLRTKTPVAEHYALDGIDLSIGRGERVGIIGRNGAGKSTLLKLISGVIEPTRGSLHVDGSARALLEIGTGFHPEFTGRENVKAYLAQIGIAGKEGERLLHEIVDFAELEEYIEQPLKTYSTGMAVRLMFATSTAVAPELLILDEVLGVGDAYFTRKSFDRIEEMCRRDGATLLLVSHDIYTSAKLCERMIWLERGRIVFDGEPSDALKAYEESIREQEENRLRKKMVLALNESGSARAGGSTLSLEVASRTGTPQQSAVHIARLGVEVPSRGASADLPLTASTAPVADGLTTVLALDDSCWGEEEQWQGVPSRPFLNYGSPFHKVGGVVHGLGPADLEGCEAVVRYWAEEPGDLVLRCFAGDRDVAAVQLPATAGGWIEHRVPLDGARDTAAVLVEPQGLYGTGRLGVEDARLVDAEGQPTTAVRHGAPLHLEFDLVVRDQAFAERCDIVVALLRDGVDTACRLFTRDLLITAGNPRATVRLTVPSARLGAGRYSVVLLVAAEGYADREVHVFYTLSPDVHVALRDFLEFSVDADGIVPQGTSWVAEGEWSLLAPDRTVIDGVGRPPGPEVPEVVPVDFPRCLEEEFPREFPVVWQAVEDVIQAMENQDVTAIGANSPGMLDFDWANYLRCSAARMVRVVRALEDAGCTSGRFLDYGAYFGNVTLLATRMGFDVDAVDAFSQYGGCFDASLALSQAAGARILDTADVGRELDRIPDDTYDVIAFLSVIEHVPHTPKPLLLALKRVLKPGGLLILDTPNHAYIYRRWALTKGESVHAPLAQQFHSPIPFEGHHREYTPSEIEWMLQEVGFETLALETFDYSRLGITELSGITLEGTRAAEQDWTAREMILSSSRKPGAF